MNQSSQRRLDDLVRSERYFTATLLPMILFHDSFRGLERFIEMMDEVAKRSGTSVTLYDRGGCMVHELPPAVRVAPACIETVEVITEFHIARDLKAARVPLAAVPAVPPDGITEPEKRDAPDVVLIVNDQLIVCEGKFFGPIGLAALNAQLRSQRRQVRHLFEARVFRPYRHVALLPFEPGKHPECTAVITWKAIADLAGELLGSEHYVTGRLKEAVRRRGESSSDDPPGQYWEANRLSWVQVQDKCRAEGDKVQVGFLGGEDALLARNSADLQGRAWKWRYADTPGNVNPRNWIRGLKFLELVKGRI